MDENTAVVLIMIGIFMLILALPVLLIISDFQSSPYSKCLSSCNRFNSDTVELECIKDCNSHFNNTTTHGK